MDSQIDSNRRARDSMDKLLAWVGRSPQVTLDPLDLKGHPWFTHRLASRDRILSRWALRAAYAAEAFCPRVLRRLFRIQPLQTAGAAATMAQGFLGLYRCRRSASHLLAANPGYINCSDCVYRDIRTMCGVFPSAGKLRSSSPPKLLSYTPHGRLLRPSSTTINSRANCSRLQLFVQPCRQS